jgi:hypothetical protein
MSHLRQFLAAVVSFALLITPVIAAPSETLGTLVYAQGAHLGSATASVGSTVFGGDRLSTDASGTLQVRTAAARFLLKSGSNAIFLKDPGAPAAILTRGTGLFSTANANAFAVHALDAVIKPNSDQPTVGQVTLLASNELLVQSIRGELACIVGGDTKLISEGEAYRVVLEANGATEANPGPGGNGTGHPPNVSGKSHAIYLLAAAVAVPTIILLVEAMESEDRP